MQKSVVHLSFSSAGGAGGVARILSETQQSLGRPSVLQTKIASSLRAHPFATPLHTLAAGIDEYVVKKPDFDAPISFYRDDVPTSFLETALDADIIHLHGVNGLVQLHKLIPALRTRPVVWTLHDMNPFTGACHYSLGCEGFQGECASCPAVRRPWQETVKKRLQRKAQVFASLTKLHLVSPSEWLRAQVTLSPIAKNTSVTVIPNPVRPEFYEVSPGASAERESSLRVVLVAQNLDDPVKNVTAAVDAFRALHEIHPAARLELVGRGGDGFVGQGISRTEASNANELIEILDRSDILVVSSGAENAPLVIAEAASRGCLPVVRNVGGMPEMVKRAGAGEVFDKDSDLPGILARYATSRRTESSRSSLRARAEKTYGPVAATLAYDKVYEEVVQARTQTKGR